MEIIDPKRSCKEERYKFPKNNKNATMIEEAYKPSDQFSTRYGNVFHILMIHISTEKGLKLFGEETADDRENIFQKDLVA